MGLACFSDSRLQYGGTYIDNIFFKNHLRYLSENCLKVYLYGLFIASNRIEEENNIASFAKNLNLSEQEIVDAFTFLDAEALVEVATTQPLEVRYPDLKQGSTRQKKIKPEKYSDFSLQVQSVLRDRMITPNEFNEYYMFIEERHIEPAALVMIIKYCTTIKGDNVSFKYILTVASDWANKGLDTVKSVTAEITCRERLKSDVLKILSALKIKRSVENEDNDLYLKWTKELGFDVPNILFAASILPDKKGGMKKLDAFLLKLYKNKAFSKEEIQAYSDNREKLRDLTKNVISELGLWFDTIDTVTTYYIQPWLNLGYSSESILFIASYCTKKNRRSLEEMGDIIANLSKQGIVSYEAITAHIVNVVARDKKLKDILREAGLSCNVNKWHIENYSKWSEQWGFSDELITYAASVSCGKVNPIPYMNAVLSSWKTNHITTTEQAQALAKQAPSQPNTFNNRVYTKEELDALIDDINDIEF